MIKRPCSRLVFLVPPSGRNFDSEPEQWSDLLSETLVKDSPYGQASHSFMTASGRYQTFRSGTKYVTTHGTAGTWAWCSGESPSHLRVYGCDAEVGWGGSCTCDFVLQLKNPGRSKSQSFIWGLWKKLAWPLPRREILSHCSRLFVIQTYLKGRIRTKAINTYVDNICMKVRHSWRTNSQHLPHFFDPC